MCYNSSEANCTNSWKDVNASLHKVMRTLLLLSVGRPAAHWLPFFNGLRYRPKNTCKNKNASQDIFWEQVVLKSKFSTKAVQGILKVIYIYIYIYITEHRSPIERLFRLYNELWISYMSWLSISLESCLYCEDVINSKLGYEILTIRSKHESIKGFIYFARTCKSVMNLNSIDRFFQQLSCPLLYMLSIQVSKSNMPLPNKPSSWFLWCPFFLKHDMIYFHFVASTIWSD